MATLEHYWKTRHWLFIAAAFSLAYMTLILYGLIPAGYELWQKRALVVRQQAQLDQVRAWADAERLTRARIRQFEDYLSAIQSESISADGLDGILTPLDTAACKAGLTVTALTAEQAVPQEGQTAWPLKIRAAGSYHQVGRFIDYIEQDAAMMVISRLKLDAPSMKRADVSLQLDLTRYSISNNVVDSESSSESEPQSAQGRPRGRRVK